MLSSGDKLTCPFCNKTTPYDKDPLSYKRNVTVVEALLPANTTNSADFHPKCDRCKSPSKKFCATCQKHFCTSCLEAHDYFFPKDHHIVDIEKMAPVELPAQPKLVKKVEPPKPEPAKADAGAKPIGRKWSVSKKVEPSPPEPEEQPPAPVPKTGGHMRRTSANATPVAPPAAAEPEPEENFPKPSQNRWKQMDAAGEVTAPSGPAPVARGNRGSAKIAAPQEEKKEIPAPAPVSPRAPETPKLPPDWAEVKDPRSGKTYYYNKKTKETSWTAPAVEPEPEPAEAEPEPEPEPRPQPEPEPRPQPEEPPSPAVDALPPGWVEAKDPKSGKTYYYNKTTKETSWKKPSASAAADELPPHWAEVKDPNSGKTYYYNKVTKETSWKRPHA